MRYEMRHFDYGWAVWDIKVNAPAVIDGRWLTSLTLDDADDLIDLLNSLDSGDFSKRQNLPWK